jgi:hypothetical protein
MAALLARKEALNRLFSGVPQPEAPAARHRCSLAHGEPITVLASGYSREELLSIRGWLRLPSWKVVECPARAESLEDFAAVRAKVVLLNERVWAKGWRHALATLREMPHRPRAVLTAAPDQQLAVSFLLEGGFEVVPTPLEGGELLRAAGMAWLEWRAKAPGQTAPEPCACAAYFKAVPGNRRKADGPAARHRTPESQRPLGLAVRFGGFAVQRRHRVDKHPA